MLDLFDRCATQGMTACPQDTANRCSCGLYAGHEGPHICAVCRSQILPMPPTGPAAESYHKQDGSPAKYIEFCATDEGRAFYGSLMTAALAHLAADEGRFSTRTFLAQYRDTHKLRINDHFSPWFADRLVLDHPRLESIIERRVRKKVGPTILDGEDGEEGLR